MECRSDSGCGFAVVVGRTDEPPLVKRLAIGDGTSEAEAGEIESPDIHDRLQALELVIGRLDVLAVGVDGSIDALLVGATWVPGPRPPDQICEVGQAWSAARRFPVDRDRSLVSKNGVIWGVEQVAMKQRAGKAIPVVGRADLLSQPLESLALGAWNSFLCLRSRGTQERLAGLGGACPRGSGPHRSLRLDG